MHLGLGHRIWGHQSGSGMPRMSPESWVSSACCCFLYLLYWKGQFTEHLSCCDKCPILMSILQHQSPDATSGQLHLWRRAMSWLQPCSIGHPFGMDCHYLCMFWLLHPVYYSKPFRQCSWRRLSANYPAALDSGNWVGIHSLWSQPSLSSSPSLLASSAEVSEYFTEELLLPLNPHFTIPYPTVVI